MAMMSRIGRERGWPPMGREQYRRAALTDAARWRPASPRQVAEKILFEHELFGHQRYLAHMSVGAVDHATCCARSSGSGPRWHPIVRIELARRSAA